MDKRMLLAAAAALAMPSVGGAVAVGHRRSGIGDWLEANGKRAPRGKHAPHLSRVIGKGWPERGADYARYFWKQDIAGSAWRLYPMPHVESKITYDPVHDRSIVESGWGYVKPTYHHGDLRRTAR